MTGYMLSDLLIILGIIISLGAQIYVKSSYNKFIRVDTKKGLSGFEVAKMILEKNGMDNVYITEVRGTLTDHYDSGRKVIRLSTDVFHGTSIASASVAAHEVGHAIQDKEGYSFMRFRAAIFPLVNIASYGGYIAVLIGLIFGMTDLLVVGIALEMVVLLFQLLTLPVEFDASNKAEKQLKKCDILTEKEHSGSKSMLKAAALTYVASVLTTILQILRLVLIAFGGRDD